MLKESELLSELTAICQVNNLDIRINEMPNRDMAGSLISLDVEHDEEGGFVGCGIYFGSNGPVYYFSNLLLLSSLPFHTFSIIAHNGKGDLECLRMWGIDVNDYQLFWDTELIAHIIDSSRKVYGLKKLSLEDLNISYPSYEDIVGKKTKKQAKERRTLDKWPIEIVSKYNGLDCFVTYKLYEYQKIRTY